MHKLFVYGTLKFAIRGSYYFRTTPRVAKTTDKFLMMGSGFPTTVPLSKKPYLSDYGAILKGEVFEINDQELQACDYYEGYPSFYDRHDTEVQYEDNGEKEKVIMYHAKEAAKGFDIFTPDMDQSDLHELAGSLLVMPYHASPFEVNLEWK